MTTQRDIALKLVGDLLAPVRDVDCVVTVCPLCQLNLEAYQRNVGSRLGERVHVPILYFTQLMGLAFALPEPELKLKANLMGTDRLFSRLGQASAWV
jgi:heterodisulfide reductase subunit B